MRRVIWLIAAILSVACQQDQQTDRSVTRQGERVARATRDLAVERIKLQTLRDSLDVKISQSIDLGMTGEQAQSVERALIDVQATVVEASEINLKHQAELLALMKSLPK